MDSTSKRALLATALLCLAACGGSGSSGGSADKATSGSSASGGGTTPPAGTIVVAPEDACAIAGFGEAMLAAVNTARATARWCGATWYPAAPALAWSAELAQAAAAHSHDMADNNFFSHTGSNGSTLVNRIDATGYVAVAWGENIYGGQTSVDAVMAGWLASAGHCANIMSANFSEIGAACARNDASAYTRYWTQDFAAPR
jgi:uncharacterized protein YkwD